MRGRRLVYAMSCCLCIRFELTIETNVRLTARLVPVAFWIWLWGCQLESLILAQNERWRHA